MNSKQITLDILEKKNLSRNYYKNAVRQEDTLWNPIGLVGSFYAAILAGLLTESLIFGVCSLFFFFPILVMVSVVAQKRSIASNVEDEFKRLAVAIQTFHNGETDLYCMMMNSNALLKEIRKLPSSVKLIEKELVEFTIKYMNNTIALKRFASYKTDKMPEIYEKLTEQDKQFKEVFSQVREHVYTLHQNLIQAELSHQVVDTQISIEPLVVLLESVKEAQALIGTANLSQNHASIVDGRAAKASANQTQLSH